MSVKAIDYSDRGFEAVLFMTFYLYFREKFVKFFKSLKYYRGWYALLYKFGIYTDRDIVAIPKFEAHHGRYKYLFFRKPGGSETYYTNFVYKHFGPGGFIDRRVPFLDYRKVRRFLLSIDEFFFEIMRTRQMNRSELRTKPLRSTKFFINPKGFFSKWIMYMIILICGIYIFNTGSNIVRETLGGTSKIELAKEISNNKVAVIEEVNKNLSEKINILIERNKKFESTVGTLMKINKELAVKLSEIADNTRVIKPAVDDTTRKTVTLDLDKVSRNAESNMDAVNEAYQLLFMEDNAEFTVTNRERYVKLYNKAFNNH